MPIVATRVERLFPDLNLDEIDGNILLRTIRVPKKLLSLTNRLPKPNYEVAEDDRNNRHTIMGSYLPEINGKKSSSCKAYIGNRRNYKRLFGINNKIGPVNVTNINKKDDNVYEKSNNKSGIIKNSNDDEYESDFDEDKGKNNDSITPNKYIGKKKPQPKRNAKIMNTEVQKENTKNDIIKLIRNKYMKNRQRGNQGIENIASSYVNKSNLYEYGGSYVSNSYIHQIINKRNSDRKSVV